MSQEIYLLCMWGLSLAGVFFMGAAWSSGRHNRLMDELQRDLKKDIEHMQQMRDRMEERVKRGLAEQREN